MDLPNLCRTHERHLCRARLLGTAPTHQHRAPLAAPHVERNSRDAIPRTSRESRDSLVGSPPVQGERSARFRPCAPSELPSDCASDYTSGCAYECRCSWAACSLSPCLQLIDDDGLPDWLPHQVRLGSLWLVAEGRATRIADSRAVDVPDGGAPDTAPDESTKDGFIGSRRRAPDAPRLSSGGRALIGIRSGLPGAVSRLFTRRISGIQGSLIASDGL